MVGIGCADKPLDNAFQGEFPTSKGNRIITEYCQSCHIHKDFESEPHVQDIRIEYRRTYFRGTQECRSCHFLENDWVHNNVNRNTRFPRDANRGVYRKFEKEEMKRKKKG